MAYLQRLIRFALWFAVGVLIAAVPMVSFAWDVNTNNYVSTSREKVAYSYSGECENAISSALTSAVGVFATGHANFVNALTAAVPSSVVCNSGAILYSVAVGTEYPSSSALVTYKSSNAAYSSQWKINFSVFESCLEGFVFNPQTMECETPPSPECAANSTINGTGDRCFCDRGYQTPEGGASYLVAEVGSCVSYCDQTIGKISIFTTTNTTSGVCMMGCWYNRESVVGGSSCSLSLDISADANSPGTYRCSMAGTGQHCDNYGQGEGSEPPAPEPEPPPPEPEPEPEPCKSGFQTVSVNGISSCVKSPPPIDNVDQAQQTTTNPDGTTTTTNKTTTTKVNDDGTVTKTTETQTTTKDQAGNTISSGTSSQSVEQGLEGFCEDNPTSSICGEQPGLFDGDCQGEIKCEGDALQCAIAASTFKTQCALSVTDDVKDAFQDMINYDGTGPGEGLDRLEINVDELQVSMSGGGAGLADQSFSIMGKTIVLPFSQLNSILAFIGYAVMVIAWLQAYKIIREAF